MDWPIVGRERELEMLRGLLEGGGAGAAGSGGGAVVAGGGAGAGAVVVGAAGIGKTRLADELAAFAVARGWAVERVRATGSGASIPLGAFAASLPKAAPDVPAREGAELLAAVRDALAERAAGRPLLLCVEDGQWLDPASATLVHQFAAAAEGVVLVTLRAGEPVPDAVRALWKDELCERLELEPLTRAQVERLLAAALGGPVDGRTANRLWELTLGNALFVRELVHLGSARGALVDDGGIWRWRGELGVGEPAALSHASPAGGGAGMRLDELVGARLEGLGERALRALEVVAVGAPLERTLLAPDEREELETLEGERLTVLRADGRRRVVDLAHPLHGEVVRARMAPTRLEAIQRRLADAVETHGARRRGDLLRVAAWRLAAGDARDPLLLERAARHALAALDVALAERCARAAVEAGGGFAAHLVLGRALAAAGRAEEAESVLAALADVPDLADASRAGAARADAARADAARADAARAAVAVARARNLFWGLERAGEANGVLRAAEEAVGDAGVRGELAAQRVRLAAAGGDPRAALAAATPLLDDAAVREQARLHAACGAVEALLVSGRADAAVALADDWLPVAERHRDELPWIGLVLASQRGLALRLSGRLVAATAASQEVYDGALRQRSPQTSAVEAALLGYAWLARGRVATALRLLRESVARLREADASGMLPWALAGVAQAAAQAGDAAAADAAVAALAERPLGHKGFEPELPLARAWAAAAGGELTRARAQALAAADLARARGQTALEVRALHELTRLGDPATAAPLLAGHAAAVDGPFARLAADHAAALVDRDAAALLTVAEAFAGLDALLVAAEAADAAAAAYREEGREASARAAATRAAAWLAKCEGARPPTLLGAPATSELTPREREIAHLAARGLSSKAIAERLVVSVRTVDNHLQGAYRKLGVARRQELAGALGASGQRVPGE